MLNPSRYITRHSRGGYHNRDYHHHLVSLSSTTPDHIYCWRTACQPTVSLPASMSAFYHAYCLPLCDGLTDNHVIFRRVTL